MSKIPVVKVIQFTSTAFIYPIFKNGYTSLRNYAERNKCKILLNEQVNRCNTITVYIREPMQRFISGVNTYTYFEQQKDPTLDNDVILNKIKNKTVLDEHFMPQFDWINRLGKYFDFWIEFVNVEELMKLIPDRGGPPVPTITDERKQKISSLNFDLSNDYVIWNEWMNKRVNIKDFIDVLSKA